MGVACLKGQWFQFNLISLCPIFIRLIHQDDIIASKSKENIGWKSHNKKKNGGYISDSYCFNIKSLVYRHVLNLRWTVEE